MFFFSFQLLVGSEDFDIRVFKEDEIVAEMTETEVCGATIRIMVTWGRIDQHIKRKSR